MSMITELMPPPSRGDDVDLRRWGAFAADVGRQLAVADIGNRQRVVADLEAVAASFDDDRAAFERGLLFGLVSALAALVDAQQSEASATASSVEQERQPLRRRVLERLSVEPARPAELARELGSPPPSINRLLRKLVDEGLAAVIDDPAMGSIDGRAQIYTATSDGEHLIDRTRRSNPRRERLDPEVERAAHVELAQALLDRAVTSRRDDRDLVESLRLVDDARAAAERAHDALLAVEVEGEALTTLRVLGAAAHREEVRRRARGLRRRKGDPLVVATARGRASYELARLEFSASPRNHRRAEELLLKARAIYLEADAEHFTRRLGWCDYSLASVWRDQWRIVHALSAALSAEERFDAVKDPYGAAHTAALVSECRRLSGDHDGAAREAERALDLAEAHGLARCKGVAYLQHGELARCRGDFDQAEIYLSKAIEHLEPLNVPGSLAYALSSYGALAYQTGDLDTAVRRLGQARKLAGSKNPETKALASRRLAVALRKLGDNDGARNAFRAAKRVYADLHSPVGMAETLVGLALLEELSDTAGAQRRLREVADCIGELAPELQDFIAADLSGAALVDGFPAVSRELHDVHPALVAGWFATGARQLLQEAASPEIDGALAATVNRLELMRGPIAQSEMSIEPAFIS